MVMVKVGFICLVASSAFTEINRGLISNLYSII